MATLRIRAVPAEFKDGFVTIKITFGATDIVRRELEVKNLIDVNKAVLEVREAVKGKDAMIYVQIIAGRKPKGFDDWKASNRPLTYVRAAESVAA